MASRGASGHGDGSTRTSTVEQGRQFENRVARLLKLLGFRVEHDVLVHGRQVDLLATSVRGPFEVSYLVECKAKAEPVSVRDFDSFIGRVESVRRQGAPGMNGLFVTTTGFAKAVRAQAAALGVELMVADELERSLLNVSPIITGQLEELQRDRGVENFVEARLRDDGRSHSEPAGPAIRRWLEDSDKNQLTLLGDFGTGKTTLLRRLTVELAEEFLDAREPRTVRAPIYVDLRNFAQIVSMRQIAFDLFDRYRAELPSFDAFSEFFQEGRLLLLLDGFDEMASKADPRVTLENFREINRAALGQAKLVLSCRTHYFVDDDHVYDFHRDGDRAGSRAYSELYQEIAGRPNFEIRHLVDFGHDEITDLIRHRLGPEAESEVWQVLHDRYNLADLARRPVLLDMILDSFGRIQDESDEFTSAVLYQVYTNIWLERNDWNASVAPDIRSLLIEEFAARATYGQRAELHYRDIPKIIRDVQPDADPQGVEQWDRELRRAGFLVRDGSGAYRFAHRSFHEFFLAKYLLRRIKDSRDRDLPGEEMFPGVRGISTEVFRFTCDLMRRDSAALEQSVRLITEGPISDGDLCLLIKFISRSKSPSVIAALEDLIVTLREPRFDAYKSSEAWDSRRTRPLCFAVTALGWLDRERDPDLFVELLEDEEEARVVRHNAVIALLRSERPEAIAAVCAFVQKRPQASISQLFSSRIVMTAMTARPAKQIADTVMDRWTADPDFAAAWEKRGQSTRILCELVEHSDSDAARSIRRKAVVESNSPAVIVAAAAGLTDAELMSLEPQILVAARHWHGTDKAPVTVAVLARLGTQGALSALVALARRGPEETSLIALRALCEKAPERVADLVAGVEDPWRRRHWSVKHRLEADQLLQANFPDTVARDAVGILKGRRPDVEEAEAALLLLAATKPEEVRSVVEYLFSADKPAAIIAFGCDLLYRIDAGSARDLLLEMGIGARPRQLRIQAAKLLRADQDPLVTTALARQLAREEDREVRLELARSLVAPGRGHGETEIADWIAQEPDAEVRAILEIGPGVAGPRV